MLQYGSGNKAFRVLQAIARPDGGLDTAIEEWIMRIDRGR